MVEGSGWDYPSGSEVVTICGEDDRGFVPALEPAFGPASYTNAGARHVDPVRIAIWVVMGMLAICVGFLALEAWGRSSVASQPISGATYPLNTVFGDRGTNTAAPNGPGGSNSACTDETIDPQTGSWSCTVWSVDTAGFPISAATSPAGAACTEQRVDESAGRWVCVSSQ